MTKSDIVKIIQKDDWMMNVLRLVRSLDLPDWYIGAGFVRSKVWDVLHGYKERTPLPDIDVIYLDTHDFTEEEIAQESTKIEDAYQLQLKTVMPRINWSVTNQARMHVFHGGRPYQSSERALAEWVETATCIGVRLTNNNHLQLATPRGINDLVNLVVRPTPSFKKNIHVFYQRVENKKWLLKWPQLKVEL